MLRTRTPSALHQTIPLFALWWIIMVRDYWEWTVNGSAERDRAFVKKYLLAVDGILWYFHQRLQMDGFVGALPYWNPIGGEDAPGTDLDAAITTGGSTYVTALLLYALEAAYLLHKEAGFQEEAHRWAETRRRLRESVTSAWNEPRGVWVERLTYPDAPVTQHTQAMAILSGAATQRQMTGATASIADGVLVARMTQQMGIPFVETLHKAGRFDLAWAQWHDECQMQLDLSLTTWLEGRSDYHAWRAWQPIEYLRSLLGIRPRQDTDQNSFITLSPERFWFRSHAGRPGFGLVSCGKRTHRSTFRPNAARCCGKRLL